MAGPAPAFQDIAGGDKPALAQALSALESEAGSKPVLDLLRAAWNNPKAHVIGITGPPGVGKSTLIGALIRLWRGAGRSVGVIAVDPSSRRTGGALLGDRIRLSTEAGDSGVFVRSMAARDRLGGLAALTVSAMVLMRAVYDVVVIETVGVGQSETDVVDAADTVVFCIQPGSGDSLQFLKAGIMEIPHIVAVTKADVGAAAARAKADVTSVLHITSAERAIPVVALSAERESGLDDLIEEIDSHRDWLDQTGRRASRRADQARIWLAGAVRERFGREGLRRAGDLIEIDAATCPFDREAEIAGKLKGP